MVDGGRCRLEHFFWTDELKFLIKDLFREGHERLPEHLNKQLTRGNEEITHWIMIINCFLKSHYTEREKNEFLKTCAGPDLERIGRPPVTWLEELKGYMMVNLKN